VGFQVLAARLCQASQDLAESQGIQVLVALRDTRVSQASPVIRAMRPAIRALVVQVGRIPAQVVTQDTVESLVSLVSLVWDSVDLVVSRE
jgi:hypothetical protein